MHNIQLLKVFWGGQGSLVDTKTKSGSGLNVETWSVHHHVLILEYLCFLSGPQPADIFGGGEQNDCKLMFYLTTKCRKPRLILIRFHPVKAKIRIIRRWLFLASRHLSQGSVNKARVPTLNPKQSEILLLNGEVVYNLRKKLV